MPNRDTWPTVELRRDSPTGPVAAQFWEKDPGIAGYQPEPPATLHPSTTYWVIVTGGSGHLYRMQRQANRAARLEHRKPWPSAAFRQQLGLHPGR